MKKKLFLVIAIVAVLACLFAISVSAAEPDKTKESVTLGDGTVCQLWDTEGNPLIWYVSATAEDGTKTYSYVDATSSAVDYNGGYSASTGGVKWYQLSSITVTVNDVSYKKGALVVLNLMSENIKITSGQNIGNHVTCFSKTFTDSSTLEYAYLPLDTVDLNGEVFKNCKALKYVNVAELEELREIGSQDFNLGETKSFMADRVLDLSKTKVTAIAANGFACCSATKIILPSTLTSIGGDAFKNCKYATEIQFNGELTSLSTSNLFYGCTVLEKITGFNFPATNTSIGNNMFYECKNLTFVEGLFQNGVFTIPEAVTSIGQATFRDMDNLVTIELSDSITSIGNQAFYSATNLKNVKLSNALTTISHSAFYDCDALVNIVIPDSVTTISTDAFNGSASLEFVKLSKNLTSIGNNAFKDCKSLQALSIETTAETFTLGVNTFLNCTAMQAVYLPDSLTTLGASGSNNYGNGTFCDTKMVYFVSEPFSVTDANGDFYTKDTFAQPSKPDVYYMPSNLSGMYGTTFRTCDNINPVVVFPESITQITCWEGAFSLSDNSGKGVTYVFLGDMEKFYFSGRDGRYNNISFFFANPLDTDIESMTFQLGYKYAPKNSYAYFCAGKTYYDLNSFTGKNESYVVSKGEFKEYAYTEDLAQHIRAPHLDDKTPADCVTPELSYTFCFCEAPLNEGKPVVTAPKLGHDYNLDGDPEVVGWNYNGNYYANACYYYICTVCQEAYDDEEGEIADSALFENLGYASFTYVENGVTFGSLVTKTLINNKAMSSYIDALLDGETVQYGIFIGVLEGNDKPVNADGTTNGNVLLCKFEGTNYANIEMKLNGIGEGAFNTDLLCGAYMILNDEVTYLTNGEVSDKAAPVKFSDFVEADA